ncbi:hypothetical protein XI03_20245 [Bradyrhizobium sp. CCBAU 65884]|uniref:hypothetical protein n=1 Tax=Bradyrhizobium sp. CCBAU 65884 TaxID=722477 RepID=UPI002FE16C3A|nr:hypothetical protein [Bradyrhizobium sp. CCBAU 65884]
MNIKPIRTEADYQASLARVAELMDARVGTPEGRELDILADLIELYESKTIQMGHPSAVAAIQFRMEQGGLSQRDLIPFIGSRAKVSEVLSGKRQLTLPMARALHEHLGIPSAVLLKQGSVKAADDDVEWTKFPLQEMAKRGWIPKGRNLSDHAEELVRSLMKRAGCTDLAVAAMYRKNDYARANAKTDQFSLQAWCLQLLSMANAERPSSPYRAGTITLDFLRKIARLSWSAEGPRLAKELLARNGIPLIILPHLPRTHLDGAAIKLDDGTPVVGLTLRYDRLDNFWFCLLHELAHVGRHMGEGSDASFVDDLTLRNSSSVRHDPRETEADEWAEEACIPRDTWEASEVRYHPTPMAVVSLAKSLQIHPAIVAGKVRYELNNYRLLTHFVGSGEVRRQFGVEA